MPSLFPVEEFVSVEGVLKVCYILLYCKRLLAATLETTIRYGTESALQTSTDYDQNVPLQPDIEKAVEVYTKSSFGTIAFLISGFVNVKDKLAGIRKPH